VKKSCIVCGQIFNVKGLTKTCSDKCSRELHKITDSKCRRNHRRKIKLKIFKLIGNKCIKCGFSDIRILQIDHVNGNGYKERTTSSTKYYRSILEKIQSGSKDYQLLCPNCNWLKRIEKGESNAK
jgi:ribosomal protein L20A (L18A)